MSTLTPEELRQIRRLYIQAGRKVDSLTAGEYRSAFRGSGMEFEKVRLYTPGDDVRRIDWNVTARSEDTYIKQFREERELTLLLVLDVSGSVRFGSGGKDGRTDKRLQIARVAGGLAYAALRSNDRIGLLRFSDSIEQYLPPRKNRGHGWEIVRAAFEGSTRSTGTDLSLALARVNRVLKRRAVVVILSDFLEPADQPAVQEALRLLSRRHRVHAFVFYDHLEDQLPDIGLLALEDAEGAGVLTVDAHALTSTNPHSLRAQTLRRAGVKTTLVATEDDAFLKLHQHFRA
jgi:uncharacterized protein (DUF58 family)